MGIISGEKTNVPEYNIAEDKSHTKALMEKEIKRLSQRRILFGILALICLCVSWGSLLINNLTKVEVEELPYEEFNKFDAENVYTAVEVDFVVPISESYYYNESTGEQNYTQTDYYCLFGSSKSSVYGIVKLEHSEYYDEVLKDIINYSKNPDNTNPPKSIMIYGNTEKIPYYVNQHLFEKVGLDVADYDLGTVCIDGMFTPRMKTSLLSVFLTMIGGGSSNVFIVLMILFFVTNKNLKKKKMEKDIFDMQNITRIS